MAESIRAPRRHPIFHWKLHWNCQLSKASVNAKISGLLLSAINASSTIFLRQMFVVRFDCLLAYSKNVCALFLVFLCFSFTFFRRRSMANYSLSNDETWPRTGYWMSFLCDYCAASLSPLFIFFFCVGTFCVFVSCLGFSTGFFFLQLLLHLLFLLLGKLFSFAGVVFIYFPHILSSRLLLVILVLLVELANTSCRPVSFWPWQVKAIKGLNLLH